MDTAKLETCPICKSVDHKNNVYVKKGDKVKIHVECADCGSFVARYTLLRYTSDKPFETLLRKLRCFQLSSSRDVLKDVEAFGLEIASEFEYVRSLVKEKNEQRKVEELIDQTFCF